MIKTMLAKIYNLSILLAFLPCFYGCNDGGEGGGSVLSSLSQLTPDGGASALTPGVSSDLTGGALHAPEPATLMMVGTGLVAWKLLSKRPK